MDAWRGHFPITSIALLSILNRAAAGQTEFTQVERILFVACEFWAAVNALELEAHLDFETTDPLREARYAFSAIGALQLVDTLHQHALPPSALNDDARRQRIAAIEEHLLHGPDSIDAMIARFARRYLCDELGMVEPAPGMPDTHRYYDQLLA